MKMRKYLLMLLVLFAGANLGFSQSVEELRASAERLKDIYSEPAALAQYYKILEKDPNDYNALWNASFLLSKIGNRLTDAEQQATYFKKAKELAENAIKQNSDHAEGHFAMSVAMGRMALISSARDRVAASKQIKVFAQTALKYDGQHPGAWDVLGRWHFKVANLSFAERAAANVLFGGAPKGASNENAVNCFKNSIKYDPDYILYYLDLAEVYLLMEGKTAETKEACNKGLSLKSKTPDDEDHKKRLKEILNEL